MTTHGTIGPFEQGKEDWTSYTERLEQYFTVNDIDSVEKRRAILLSVWFAGGCTLCLLNFLRTNLQNQQQITKYFYVTAVTTSHSGGGGERAICPHIPNLPKNCQHCLT